MPGAPIARPISTSTAPWATVAPSFCDLTVELKKYPGTAANCSSTLVRSGGTGVTPVMAGIGPSVVQPAATSNTAHPRTAFTMPQIERLRKLHAVLAAGRDDELTRNGVAVRGAIRLDRGDVLGMSLSPHGVVETRIGEGDGPTDEGGAAGFLCRRITQARIEPRAR